MRSVVLAVAGLLASMRCWAEPTVTITCEPLKGLNDGYGLTPTENQLAVHKPIPKHYWSEEDGYSVGNTFIVDVKRRTITILWADGKDPAHEIPLTVYSEDVIAAVLSQPSFRGPRIEIYSFYPKVGVGFMSLHYLNLDGASAHQSALHARCSFVS